MKVLNSKLCVILMVLVMVTTGIAEAGQPRSKITDPGTGGGAGGVTGSVRPEWFARKVYEYISVDITIKGGIIRPGWLSWVASRYPGWEMLGKPYYYKGQWFVILRRLVSSK